MITETYLDSDTIQLVEGTFGCPCGKHVRPDPYPAHVRQPGESWHEAAAGDGGSYSGVVETLTRRSEETRREFESRVWQVADELSRCDRSRRWEN